MPRYPFRNLIFEGGGVKGIAYVGAVGVLEQKGITQNIQRVAGTSVGAINALLFGLNYTNDDVQKILWKLDFRNFKDDTWGFIPDTIRLIRKFGWYKGDFFRNWIADLIAQKTGNSESTFKDLYALRTEKGFRDIYMIGTNLSTHFSEIFSYEHSPDMPVADAVRISMSIPLFFTAQRRAGGDVYVDGGVLDNYPVKLFDRARYIEPAVLETHSMKTDYYASMNDQLKRTKKEISPYVYNMETMGFCLDTKQEISMFEGDTEPVDHKIDSFFEYSWGLIETVMDAQANQHLHADDWQRTIYIDSLGVKATQFDLDKKTKQALVKSGFDNTTAYFEKWYDNLASKPVNRPKTWPEEE